MKKAILAIGVASSLLLLLIGCNGGQSEKQEEVPSATVAVEETAPVEPTVKVDEAQPMAARTNLTQEELIGYFEAVYNAGQLYADLGYDEDSLIEQELKELGYFVEDGTSNWPDDVYQQYLVWRILNHSQEPETTEAPSSNPQTKPVQQAPSTTNNNQQAGGNVDTGSTGSDYDEAHHIDPTQSSFFPIPDDPWSSNAKIDYGGD